MFLLLLLLSLLPAAWSWTVPLNPSISDTSAVITGLVQNNCGFDIHVTSSCCYPSCTSDKTTISPGGTYWNPVRSFAIHCSQTIIVSRTGDFVAPAPIYQIEYNIDDNGELWYNLSSVDGDPFHDVARYLEVRGQQCKTFYCKPGEPKENCDWPKLADCPAHSGNDVAFYVC